MQKENSNGPVKLKNEKFLKISQTNSLKDNSPSTEELISTNTAWKIALGMLVIGIIVLASQYNNFSTSKINIYPVFSAIQPGVYSSALQVAVNATMFFGNSSNQSTVDFESCNSSGNCIPTYNATDRSYSWRIFAELGLYQRTHNSLYANRMISDFSLLTNSSFAWGAPFYSSYQIGRAYLQINYTPMLDYFYTTNRDALNAQPGDLATGNPMLEATLSREYALTALMLNNSNSLDYLISSKYVITNSSSPLFATLSATNQRQQFLNASEFELTRSIFDSSFEPLTLSDMPDFRLDECWIISAKYDLYLATKNPDYLNNVKDFFNRANFASRPSASIDLQYPSQIHPCIDVLEQLSATNSSYVPDVNFLLQNFVIRSWDSSSAPICNGDGGFLSIIPSDPSIPISCSNQLKSDSNAGYSIYLLANNNNTSYLIGN